MNKRQFLTLILILSLLLAAMPASAADIPWHLVIAGYGENIARTAMQIDIQGYPHIAYADAGALRYVVYNGATWDSTVFSDDQSIDHVSLALDAQKHPHISYNRGLNLTYLNYNGANWSSQSIETGSTLRSAIAVKKNGNPVIAYVRSEASSAGNIGLAAAIYNGSQWTTSTIETGIAAADVALALDSSDNPHITYIKDGKYLRYARWTGFSWEVYTLANDARVQTAIAIDSFNFPHVAFSDGDRLIYLTFNGTLWGRQVLFSNLGRIEDLSLSLGLMNMPHIMFSVTNDWLSLRYVYSDVRGWYLTELDAAGTARHPSLAMDSRGFPYLSFCVSLTNIVCNQLDMAYLEPLMVSPPVLSSNYPDGDMTSTFTFTGHNFYPDSTVKLAGSMASIGAVQADSSGKITVVLNILPGAEGTHVISAMDSKGRSGQFSLQLDNSLPHRAWDGTSAPALYFSPLRGPIYLPFVKK